jgi:Aldo/keto reductase family
MKQFLPERQRTERIVGAVKSVSDEVGRSMAQVALAWLRYRPVAVIPIIGARKLSQLRDNLALRDRRARYHGRRCYFRSAIEIFHNFARASGPGYFQFFFQSDRDAPNIVLADSVSIAIDRTTRDVLNIVYGAQNAHKGLFFPAGLNGVIK